MRKLYSLAILSILLVAALKSDAQFVCDNITYFCITDGTITTCSGNFVDDGASNPYSDTPWTMTICPDNAGDVIQLDFVAFNLQESPNPNNSDYLSFYDGDDDSYQSLGSYTGNDFQNHQVTGTVNNITGCLTIVFDPNGLPNNGSPGWQATISCTTPCASPTAVSVISDPDPIDPNIQTVSVCLDVPITFSDAGSFAEPGFTIDQYIWNFDDGVIDTLSGAQVTHTFSEPGEYLVVLAVEDNNGCQNLNLEALQVLVSTVPQFPGIAAMETGPFYTCTETEIGIDANSVGNTPGSGAWDLIYPTWSALPPQVVSGTSYLADGAGFSYSTSLVFDFFETDAVIEDCSQIENIFVNMEHSYMGDLEIFVTCPDGTSVNLLNFPNSGGSLFIGDAIDIDDPNEVGVGFDYSFTTDATETWNEWVIDNGYTYGESLPGGIYESEEDLCGLVGCPLNGEWTFNVTDWQGIDDGFIFWWGITFDAALYPGITTFTPTAGAGADSTFWSGPYMSTDPDGDMMFIDPPPGNASYDYTYTVINSFGCEFDTTITLNFQDALAIDAGPDQFTSCGIVTLQGGFENQPAPSCGTEGGTFTYCYGESENFTWTFCPDNIGDGVSFMSISFIAGMTENFWDQITIYDGDDTSDPIIATGIQGDLAGLSWTATNPDGCISLSFYSDGSVSCEAGWETEWEYEISCTNGGPTYIWEWEPAAMLDNPNIPGPMVVALNGNTTFTLVGYPEGFPDCATTDQVDVINTDEPPYPGEDGATAVCPEDAVVDLFTLLQNNPDVGGEWIAPNGNDFDGTFDPDVDAEGEYYYAIGAGICLDSAAVDVNVFDIDFDVSDTTICINGTAVLYATSPNDPNDSWQYTWTGEGNGNYLDVMPGSDTSYDVSAITDNGCATATLTLDVTLFEPLEIEMAPGDALCNGDDFVLEVNSVLGGDGGPYNFQWQFNGTVLGNGQAFNTNPGITGDYCVTVTDGCETPQADGCIPIEVELPVTMEFETDTVEGCVPATFQFTSLIDPTAYASLTWTLSDTTTISNEEIFSHTFDNPGLYDVGMLIISPNGCQYSLFEDNYLSVHNNPMAAFSSDPSNTIIPNTTIQFTDKSIDNIVEWYWEFDMDDENSATSTEQNPTYTYPMTGGDVYDIMLLVTDNHNCVDSTTGRVNINDLFAVYIPNSFTPNGDGINDVFQVVGSDISPDDFTFQVFSRWGDVLFESNDINSVWTGNFKDGEHYVPDGVYVWRMEANAISTLEKKELVGTVFLMR